MEFTLKELRHANMLMFPSNFIELWILHAPEDQKEFATILADGIKRHNLLWFIQEYGSKDDVLDTLSKMIKDTIKKGN